MEGKGHSLHIPRGFFSHCDETAFCSIRFHEDLKTLTRNNYFSGYFHFLVFLYNADLETVDYNDIPFLRRDDSLHSKMNNENDANEDTAKENYPNESDTDSESSDSCNSTKSVSSSLDDDISEESDSSIVNSSNCSQDSSNCTDDIHNYTDDSDNCKDKSPTENIQEPLYPGAPITVIESILSILTLITRLKISGVMLTYILELINLHCIKPNYCLTTLYRYKKFFQGISTPLTRHFYCSSCHSKLENEFCIECNSKDNINYFIEIPIIEQLNKMFSRVGFYELLNQRFTREKNNTQNYEDIYDGEVYKSAIKDLSFVNISDLTFTWNTDGVSLFKSSKMGIWPLYLVINELPYKERFKKENVVFAGLWFGYDKPLPNMFLRIFVDDFLKLYEGIKCKIANMTHVIIRGIVLCGTCDLPAKALMLNFKNYNGDFGCTICKIRTKRVDKTQTYPFKRSLELRALEETKCFAAEAEAKNKARFGVKGPSALDLFVLDYVKSTAIDIMHCAYEGVMKQLLKIWFDVKFNKHAASLIEFKEIINTRIRSLKPPSFVPRIPRSITDSLYFKASEYKAFLYYYSLPLLHDIMDSQFFNHHILLVHGLSLLNSSSISELDILEAQSVLTEYVARFEFLYGAKNMSSNIHLLLHLPDNVRKFGPLWVTSCMTFENLNGVLKSFVHGTRYAHLQIYSAVSKFLSAAELKQKFLNKNSETYRFCKKLELSGTHRRKLKEIQTNIFAVGKVTKLKTIPDIIRNALDIQWNRAICFRFKQLLKHDIFYESNFSSTKKKSNSSYCIYKIDGRKRIGIIDTFISVCFSNDDEICGNCTNYAIIIDQEDTLAFRCPVVEHYMNTIFKCKDSTNRIARAVEISKLESVCFNILNVEQFVIIPLNTQEFE